MDVNLIFRIAAVGILVSVVCQVLKHSGGAGLSHQPGRSSGGAVLDGALHLPAV